MAKKILFVFGGTGVNAQMIRDFTEGKTEDTGETFNDDVIRVYFNGCQDKHIGGHSKLKGYLDPNLDVVANKVRHAFSKDDVVTLNLVDLKKEFGSSIIIEPKEGLTDVVEVDDITLNGFSRGAVATFATARALDDLDTPISLLAEDPVPGNDRENTYKHDSLYAKNFDLSHCRNIARGEILLGTYSKHNKGWENKWFRQMAPKFNTITDSHIFMVPKKMHVEFNRRATTYTSSFLYNRGLTTTSLAWREENDRAYVIPKVEQQKFHFGVVGRAEYLPSYKMSVLRSLKSQYDPEIFCPIGEGSKFKWGQALLALHNATMDEETFKILSKAVLKNTDKGKGLREFIVEFDSIVQYSKEQSTLKADHRRTMAELEKNTYKLIADFYKLENPSLKEKEALAQAIQSNISLSKRDLPSNVYDKLKELTTILLVENTLVHSHLVKFIDENETFSANLLTADQPALDGAVTNAEELSQKLFHSSVRQRTVIFEQEKKSLGEFITNAADLANIASFLTPKQLKEVLEINNKITTMADVLLLMNTLPTYEHRKIIYHAVKENLIDMKPTLDEVVVLMEYLSDKKCQELCRILPIQELELVDLIPPNDLMRQKLTDSKITLLKKVLEVMPEETISYGVHSR
ncbi:hypothetical protein [Legionella cincinnatiensis]|uniref:Uncharacterized protein n=1 Tax=Legionella cincinnatiensis TaxID=28085 RepID=A0A378ING4_9GAMM|nr:hypothetical protein [Legionella cincinnatiensis]KTC85296.1 hypothetical protein Lcin_1796 [Legionella cincinnatiensis]STX36342.1 Uncharacterised protein [Legionella cincinnatiensis]